MLATQWRAALQNPSQLPFAAIARLLTWLVVVMLAWLLGRLVWQVIQPVEPIAKWSPTAVATASNTSGPRYNLRQLQQMELFGKYEAQAKPEPVKQEVVQNAPETRLNLNLVGVVASTNPTTSLAIIANRNQQNTYKIDDPIEGTRATLVAVFADRVIIRNSGRDETLMLDGNKFTSQSAAPSRPVQRAATAPANDVDQLGEKLGAIKAEIMANPQNMFNYIRLSQVKKEGALLGYRVNPGKERTLFDAVGLMPNDLAVTLNGSDLTDPSTMATLFQELQQATSLSLSVERDGQLHDIYIDLQ
ncbi:type II secretion system protein GspC [Thaumasiovibrio subtropicus]|uniref:type II secretion system protein GspC n=1 Tax=Thaumasiovibrio subtropicus TaxID=1891207 RepID=UPI000B35E5F6|nr:type II secretion system protein GspC [Thaumasiovibrio subtropicus]